MNSTAELATFYNYLGDLIDERNSHTAATFDIDAVPVPAGLLDFYQRVYNTPQQHIDEPLYIIFLGNVVGVTTLR
ncbi:unnamed protein product, partial [Peniophora sp. CBMAI 1063]